MVHFNGKTYSKAVTRDGRFNAQQVLCASLLRLVDPNITIERTPCLAQATDSLVFGELTLIPKDYRDTNNVKYGCFGYMWKVLCHNFPLTEKQIIGFDLDICVPMDLSEINPSKRSPLDILFSSFNNRITENNDQDGFEDAVNVGVHLLDMWLKTAYSANYARNVVKDAVARTPDPRILVLTCPVPTSALPKGTLFMAYPNAGSKTYTIRSLRQPDGSFVLFPADWCHADKLPVGIKFCNSKRNIVQVKGDKFVLQACYFALLSNTGNDTKRAAGGDAG